jgi:hypothetical protein
MQLPSAYHVLVRTANDMVVVEGQASALSLRYEERPKRIPLLIRLPREVARCLALKGTQQPTMMNDQQQRVLVSVRGGEGGLGLTSRLRFLGPDGYSGPWYRCVHSFEFRFVYSYASVIRMFFPAQKYMASPGRGGAWHHVRWFWYGFKRVATMGTGLACACPRLSLRSHARCL